VDGAELFGELGITFPVQPGRNNIVIRVRLDSIRVQPLEGDLEIRQVEYLFSIDN
jgi:hypothetical protein